MKLLILLTICGYTLAQLSSDTSVPDLVFVVDKADTVLLKIKTPVSDFLHKLSQEEKTRTRNYTLVPFTDKDAELITHKDVESFARTLDSQGSTNTRRGGKPICSGKSLTGIKKGLESAGSKSVIIVLTDAIPNDKNLISDIKRTIAANHSKVIFVLIQSNCGDPQSKEYQEISLVSNGQIFKTTSASTSTALAEILKSIQSLIEPQRVELLATDEEPKSGQGKSFKIPMSKEFSDVLITISASNSFTLSVTDPENEESACQMSNHWATCKIEKPLTGNYTINVGKMNSTYAVRASATSSLTFHYGFQTFENKDSSNAKHIFSQPLKDVNNTFIVKFDNPSQIKAISSVKIISADGSENSEPLTMTPTLNNTVKDSTNYGVYYTFFKLSDTRVHLKIIGTTDNDEEFQLITPVALYPSSGNDKNNPSVAKDIRYVSWEELTQENQTNPPKNSAKLNCSSFFMTTLALLFLVVKTAIYN